MESRNIEVEIKGIVPLLQNRFPEEDPNALPTKIRRKVGVKEKKIEIKLYETPDGELYQPASHIEGALIKAAVNFQIPGRGKKTYKDLFKSSVFVFPDAILHDPQVWIIDKRSGVNPNTRGRIMIERPKLMNWKLKFTLSIQDPDLPESAVKEIFEYAGLRVGIGDFRPRFGRFTITSWKHMEEE